MARRTFINERFDQRIDEILDVAQRDPAEAKLRARRFLRWLVRIQKNPPEPEIEAAIEQVLVLLELLN